MASGSYFVILRYNNDNKFYDKSIIDNYIVDFKEYARNRFNSAVNIEKYQKLPLNLKFDDMFDEPKEFRYVSIDTYKIYDEIGTFYFISGFTKLKEFYNMDAFRNSEVEISLETAQEIKIAAEYLLNRDYSLKTEDLLDNYFIRCLGEQLPSYEHFISGNEEPFDNNDCFECEGRNFLRKTLDVMRTFIRLMNENSLNEAEYKLIYYCW